MNYAKAVFNALEQNTETRISATEIKNISIVSGSIGLPQKESEPTPPKTETEGK